MKKRNKSKALNIRLDRERILSEYSFTIALAVIPFLEWLRSFLEDSDPSEQLFYDNFMIIAYVVLVLPILARVVAVFIPVINIKYLTLFLTKRQKHNLESYKVQTGNLQTDIEMKEQARLNLYFYSVNNLMWFYYIIIGMFAITTITLYLLFSIPITLFNAIPSLMLLIYKVIRIEIKKRRVS